MKFKKLIVAGMVTFLTYSAVAERQPLTSGIDMTAVDTTVRPQDDFWHYVNGTWLKDTKIPADKSRLSMFGVLADEADKQLKSIIQDAAKAGAENGSNQQKLGDLYNSFMDVETIEKLGISPLQSELDAIQALSDYEQVASEMGALYKGGVSGPLGFYVYPDAKNPGVYGFWL